jgi:hypothetical protein
MTLKTRLQVAEMRLAIIQVTYCLGNKDLGEYQIEETFPQTLLLAPVDNYRSKIWIPNPRALESKFVCTVFDNNKFRLEIWEYPMIKVWQLEFKYEDVT